MFLILRYSLCLYMLLLALLPCADAHTLGATVEQAREEYTIAVDNSNSTHQHTEVGDICTPFCACACCGLHPTLDPIPTLTVGQVLGSAHKIHLCRRLGEETSVYTPAVWQPPQQKAVLL